MIIETKLELDNFLDKYQTSSCILIPVLSDANKHPLENSLCLLYIKILGGESSRLLNLDIAGVDLLFDENGYQICEVNSSPGFEGMDKFTKTNIAEQIVTYVKHRIGYSDSRNET